MNQRHERQVFGCRPWAAGVLAAALAATPLSFARPNDVSDLDGEIAAGRVTVSQAAGVATGVGLLVPHAAAAHDRALYDLSVAGSKSSRSSFAWKNANGIMGEAVVRDWLNRPSSSGRWLPLAPPVANKYGVALGPESRSRMGLDGVYIKVDAQNRLRDVMVTEVKFGGARPRVLATGCRQTEACYVEPRLSEVARHYMKVAEDVARPRGLAFLSEDQVPSRVSHILLRDGTVVRLWWDPYERTWAVPIGDRVPSKELASAIRRYADRVGKAAATSSYRSRLFNVSVQENGSLNIDISRGLSPGSVEPAHIESSEIKFVDLRPTQRNLIAGAIRSAMQKEFWSQQFRANHPTLSDDRVESLVNRIVNEAERTGNIPKLVSDFNAYTAASHETGPFILRTVGTGGAVGGAMAVLAEILAAPLLGASIDGGHLVQTAALGTVAGGVGSYVGISVASEAVDAMPFARTLSSGSTATALSPRKASALRVVKHLGSGIAGGTAAGAVFAYGSYILGDGDLAAANRNLGIGIAGATAGTAAYAATMGLVTTLGTASTGTAIATLHGAAATNAAMAWLGGGSLASGGWGMAGGALVIGSIATVAVIGYPSGQGRLPGPGSRGIRWHHCKQRCLQWCQR